MDESLGVPRFVAGLAGSSAVGPPRALHESFRLARKQSLRVGEPHLDAGRFLTVPQVAEELGTSEVQVIAMLRRGDIRGLQLGGRK